MSLGHFKEQFCIWLKVLFFLFSFGKCHEGFCASGVSLFWDPSVSLTAHIVTCDSEQYCFDYIFSIAKYLQLYAGAFLTSKFILWQGRELSLFSLPVTLYPGLFLLESVAALCIPQQFASALEKASSAWIHPVPPCWVRCCVTLPRFWRSRWEWEGEGCWWHTEIRPHCTASKCANFIKVSRKYRHYRYVTDAGSTLMPQHAFHCQREKC